MAGARIIKFPDLKAEERRSSGIRSSNMFKMYGVEGEYYHNLSAICREILGKETKIINLKTRMLKCE